MKAADFDYVCPRSIAETCRLLASANGEGRIIAGGQTLVPLMAMRLARPALLVDINRIAELQGMELSEECVTLKACTRQADALSSDAVREHVPLLSKAISFVGHGQTRNRGTVGGSLANADPAAEICLAALALDSEITACQANAERTIPADAFFRGAMTTALASDECLTEARFPIWREMQVGTGFQEASIRRSDFALAASAVQLALDNDERCARIAIALGGLGGAPVRAPAAEKRLTGTRLDEADITDALSAMRNTLHPHTDIHASAEYRRRVLCELTRRAIEEARREASQARA